MRYFLFKFGKQEHVDQFVHEGLMFMNTLKKFKTLENGNPRSDRHEGTTYSYPADKVKKFSMERNGEWVDLELVKGSSLTGNGKKASITNVFCMYAFCVSISKNLVDPRNFKFGDTFAMLKDGDEFLRRVDAVAKKKNIVLGRGLVEYVDKSTYVGKMGVFRKYSEFAYQSEFRFFVITGNDTPFILKIGDISDISKIGSVEELKIISSKGIDRLLE